MMFFQQATLAYMIHHLLQKEDIIGKKSFYNWIDNGKMEYKELNDGFKQFIEILKKKLQRYLNKLIKLMPDALNMKNL